MKKIQLALTNCVINGETSELDYREQLLALICNPADGMNLAEMRNIEKVYDKLSEAQCPGSVLLEDAEHATLEGILRQVKFRVFSKDIKTMVESVISAEAYEVPRPMRGTKTAGNIE